LFRENHRTAHDQAVSGIGWRQSLNSTQARATGNKAKMSRDLNVARELLVRGVQMFLLRVAFATLITLFGSIADAGPQAVPRKFQAGFYLEGCKDFIAGRSNFLSGAVSEPSRFLMNWALIVNCSVHRRPSPTLSRCVSSSHILKLYPSE
jgi:hypothetical protein